MHRVSNSYYAPATRTRGRVAIIGAGTAGLSSAIAHVEHGYEVTLIEASHRLGGRAWARIRDRIDNGPHVLLGGYRGFRRLLRTIGSEKGFDQRPSLELSYLLRGGKLLRLKSSTKVPAPLHLGAALLQVEGLDISGGLDLLFSAFATFALAPRPEETVLDWAKRRSLGEWSQRIYLEPLCRAVMNAEPEQASAKLFVATLREAFSGNHGHSAMWVPKRSWHALLHEPSLRYCERHHVQLRLGDRVRSLVPGEKAPKIVMSNGEHLSQWDRVVLATPWGAAKRLLGEMPEAKGLGEIKRSPIVTVHFEIPEKDLGFRDPIVALVGGAPFHFICRRSAGDGYARQRSPVSLLAGAATSLDGIPGREIAVLAAQQLASWLGRKSPFPIDTVENAKVIRESAATIMPEPGVEARRPAPGPSSLPGLWLAGDWCDVGLPSTLEGAARSAFAPFDRGLA
ncbi:MAG: hypothetical protein CSA62_10080 [Planctomycetota bacterium]|nr:MAG: hypothetical protein CSA62_10080 [Planctomycetota bacterium]